MKVHGLIVSFLVMFQASSVCAQSCDCLFNFNYLVEKIEKNYAGYSDKIDKSNQAAFVSFTDSLRQEASKVGTANCLPILHKWVNFFKDPHVVVYFDESPDNLLKIDSLLSDVEKVNVNEMELKKYFEKRNLDSIEGIWASDSKAYLIAIKKNEAIRGEFVGFVLEAKSRYWKPGHVKMRFTKKSGSYRAIFNTRFHVPEEVRFKLSANRMDIDKYGTWFKQTPVVSSAKVAPAIASNPSRTFQLKKINPETYLLVLPSFTLDHKAEIDSLIENNLGSLVKTPNLIIDVRNNLGGYNYSFEKVMRLLYTQPIFSMGYSVLATDDNIDLFKRRMLSNDYPDTLKKKSIERIRQLEQHKNEWVNLFPEDSLQQEKVYPFPARVGILMNEYSGSSTEFFLHQAAQSTKTTLFGKPSVGTLDYTDNIIESNLPCKVYGFYWSTCRNNALDTEPNFSAKILPDVTISSDVADWVAFIINYWKTVPSKQ